MTETPALTDRQKIILHCSGFDRRDGNGFGVHLIGASDWRTARSLVKRGLGWIEGGYCQGSNLPGLFFANHEGTALAYPEESQAWRDRRAR